MNRKPEGIGSCTLINVDAGFFQKRSISPLQPTTAGTFTFVLFSNINIFYPVMRLSDKALNKA